MKISSTQQKIIDYKGHLVVKAPPGSGKTFTMVNKIKNVQSRSNKKIIALTFSNKAAEELEQRIENKENVVVGTIHAFCQEIVLSRGFLIDLPEDLNIINDDLDKLYIIREVINNNPNISSHINDKSDNYLKKILDFIKVQKQNFIQPMDLLNSSSTYNQLYYDIYEGYNNKMISQKMIDFDDLLFYAYIILSKDETISLYKRIYGHLFIDEAQDLNLPQYQIIKLLSSIVDDVMLVGDPSQAIYKFMGSDKKIMEEIFVNDFNAKVIELNENYRSSKKIVKLINAFKKDSESLNKYPIEGEVTYKVYSNENEEAMSIINKIIFLHNTENIPYKDIAILGRNAYLFEDIKKQLENNQIPYNVGSMGSIEMESEYGNLLLEYIKLVTNPHNERLRNYFKKEFNLESNNIEKIKIEMNQKNEEIYNFVEKILLTPSFFENGIINIIERISKEKNESEEEKYLILGDLNLLKDNWINFIKKSKYANKNLKTFMNELIMGKTMIFNLEGVSILTVHKSKGLGFDTTFVVGLNEGTLPDYRAVKSNDLIEEDNNVYVALSRAKKRCYISSVEYRMMPWGSEKLQQESRYVNKILETIKKF